MNSQVLATKVNVGLPSPLREGDTEHKVVEGLKTAAARIQLHIEINAHTDSVKAHFMYAHHDNMAIARDTYLEYATRLEADTSVIDTPDKVQSMCNELSDEIEARRAAKK